MPSSRAQICATAARVLVGHPEGRLRRHGALGRTAAPPRTAPAARRTRRRSPAALRQRPARARARRSRRRSPAPPGWWPGAGGRGQAPQQRVGQPGAGVQQVLAVVQHQQQRAWAAARRRAWPASGRPGSSRTPTRLRPPPGAPGPGRPGPPAPPATPRPGTPSRASAAACRARRVLPVPPGPVRVSSRWAASSAATSASSRSRPTKLVSCRGRLCGSASSERRGGKSPGTPGRQQLEHALRPLQVPQPVGAQVAQGRPGRQGVRDQLGGRPREHHLPPVGRRQQPPGAVERRAEVVPALPLDLAGVQRHPRPEGARAQVAPVRRLQGQLPRQGRRPRRRWGGRRRRRPRPPPSRTPPPRAASTAPRSRAWWRRTASR